jgi:3-phenylpropionate/cinnamic acid dioxygenase small subunit
VIDRHRLGADRQAITELCTQYATALDTKDWALLARCFTTEPVFVHPGGRLVGFEQILARTSAALTPLTLTQHLLGNITPTVDADGATARCSTYFHAQHVRTGTPGGDRYVIAGRYDDALLRTSDGWRIGERMQSYQWRAGNRAVVAR